MPLSLHSNVLAMTYYALAKWLISDANEWINKIKKFEVTSFSLIPSNIFLQIFLDFWIENEYHKKMSNFAQYNKFQETTEPHKTLNTIKNNQKHNTFRNEKPSGVKMKRKVVKNF